MTADYGILQHGARKALDVYREEKVLLRFEAPDTWFAFYGGTWRKVHTQVHSLFILFKEKRIKIRIEGV